MKKVIFLIACIVFAITKAQAQDTIVTIPQLAQVPGKQIHACANKYNRVALYAPEGCTGFKFKIDGEWIHEVSPVYFDKNVASYFGSTFYGCGYSFNFGVYFDEPNVPTSTIDTIWVRAGELASLSAVGSDSVNMYSFHWDTGETMNTIYKPRGTYVCAITDEYGCDVAYRTKVVLENVELYRATVDLETNLNKVTWQVMAEQAEYISEVKVYRDGLLVGTVPYESGYYLDAIGSDNAARNYRIVGVTPEGEDCPIASYEKGTIHTTYYEDVNHNLNMTWNIPFVEEGAQGTPTYFQICKYDPATGDLTVVDQVNATITDYTCGVNQFDGGQAVIAAVFSDAKGLEELAFSNLTTDILGLGENSLAVKVYPSPTSGEITVECEGLSHVRIVNAYGQTVYNADLEGGQTRIDLSQMAKGIYMMHIEAAEGQTVRKIVVE